MGYAIALGIGFVVGFVLARYFDDRLDKVQASLTELSKKLPK